MRFVAMTTAVLPCSLVPGPGQAQTTAVQPDQSPQQADQTRGQERVRGEDVRSAATGRLNRAVLIAPGMLARRRGTSDRRSGLADLSGGPGQTLKPRDASLQDVW